MNKVLQSAASGASGPQIANPRTFEYEPNKFNLARGDKSTMQRLPNGGAGMDIKTITKSINKLFSKESGIALDA